MILTYAAEPKLVVFVDLLRFVSSFRVARYSSFSILLSLLILASNSLSETSGFSVSMALIIKTSNSTLVQKVRRFCLNYLTSDTLN